MSGGEKKTQKESGGREEVSQRKVKLKKTQGCVQCNTVGELIIITEELGLKHIAIRAVQYLENSIKSIVYLYNAALSLPSMS